MSKDPVRPRAYTLGNTGLPFSRSTWFRWEAAKTIPPLLRLGGKTLVQSETVDDIIAGRIILPSNAGRTKTPAPRSRPGRKRIHPKREQSISAAE
jgi:hypothetical protein